jgi:hypothetical protein
MLMCKQIDGGKINEMYVEINGGKDKKIHPKHSLGHQSVHKS